MIGTAVTVNVSEVAAGTASFADMIFTAVSYSRGSVQLCHHDGHRGGEGAGRLARHGAVMAAGLAVRPQRHRRRACRRRRTSDNPTNSEHHGHPSPR